MTKGLDLGLGFKCGPRFQNYNFAGRSAKFHPNR